MIKMILSADYNNFQLEVSATLTPLKSFTVGFTCTNCIDIDFSSF